MFKYLEDVDLSNYGMFLNKTCMKIEPGLSTIDLEFTLPSLNNDLEESAKNVDRFFLDLRLLNTIRGSTSTAVKKHYEELLTLLALSKTNV